MLSGAGYPDIAVLTDGVPGLYTAPGASDYAKPIANAPSGCTAMAVRFYERSPNGYRRDQLLVSTPGGIRRWARTAATPWTFLDASFKSAPWNTARQLLSVDVNDDGIEDLIALSSQGDKVAVRLGTPTGFGATYTRSFAESAVLAITTTAWDTTPGREIAIATADSVTVFDNHLAVSAAVITVSSGSQAILASPRSAGQPGGELLVLANAVAGQWKLFSIDSTTPQSVALGSVGLVACAVGDVNADGNDDLVFSKTENHRSSVFLQGGPTHFIDVSLEVPLIGTTANWTASAAPAPNNAAWPIVADFDGNGAADLMQPVEDTGDLVLAMSPYGIPHSIGVLESSELTGTFGVPWESGIRLDLQTADVPAGTTHIEVAISFLDLGLSTNRVYCAGGFFQAFRFPIEELHPTIPLEESCLMIGGCAYVLQLRPLQVADSGTGPVVVRAHRPTTFLFAIDEWESIIPRATRYTYDASYLTSFYSALPVTMVTIPVSRQGGPTQTGSGAGSGGGSKSPGHDASAKGDSGGGIGPSSNGGINTGIVIGVNPPPPPTPPATGSTSGPG